MGSGTVVEVQVHSGDCSGWWDNPKTTSPKHIDSATVCYISSLLLAELSQHFLHRFVNPLFLLEQFQMGLQHSLDALLKRGRLALPAGCWLRCWP